MKKSRLLLLIPLSLASGILIVGIIVGIVTHLPENFFYYFDGILISLLALLVAILYLIQFIKKLKKKKNKK